MEERGKGTCLQKSDWYLGLQNPRWRMEVTEDIKGSEEMSYLPFSLF